MSTSTSPTSTPNVNMTLSRSRMVTGQMLRTSYGTHLMDLRMMVRPFFRASTKTSPRTPTSAQTLCTSTSTLTEIRRGLAGDWSGKLWWVDAVNIEVSWDMNHVLNLLNVNKAIWDTNCLRNFINLKKDLLCSKKLSAAYNQLGIPCLISNSNCSSHQSTSLVSLKTSE